VATLPIRLIGRIDTQARRYPVVRHSTVEGLEFRLIGPRAPLPEAEQLSDLDLAVHPDDWDRVREAVGFEPPVGRIHGCAICGGQWLGDGLPTVLPYFLDCRSNHVYYASACSPECVDRALTKVRGKLRQAVRREIVRRETRPTSAQANGHP
jgi:hypothetical protein